MGFPLTGKTQSDAVQAGRLKPIKQPSAPKARAIQGTLLIGLPNA